MNCDSLFMTHDRESLSLQNVKYSRAESVFSRFHAPFFILAHSQGSMQGFEILKCGFHNLTIYKIEIIFLVWQKTLPTAAAVFSNSLAKTVDVRLGCPRGA